MFVVREKSLVGKPCLAWKGVSRGGEGRVTHNVMDLSPTDPPESKAEGRHFVVG